MNDQVYFEDSSQQSCKGKAKAKSIAHEGPRPCTKPLDDFTTSTVPIPPGTTFYLSVIKPHADTSALHGPVRHFSHLLPHIESVVSNSPSAIDKLAALKELEDAWGDVRPNHHFYEHGFRVMVVEGQRSVFTVLNVERREEGEVWGVLPGAVYTVVKAGPLSLSTSEDGPKGYAATMRLVGSFVERKDARGAAKRAMDELVSGMEEAVHVTETWEKEGRGGGMLMAMGGEEMCEVKVLYEDQALRRAKEGLDREGGKVGWRF
ncbi:Nn.00g102450.m01.CDS01 [Neocucurbitaria sp. VM-36]